MAHASYLVEVSYEYHIYGNPLGDKSSKILEVDTMLSEEEVSEGIREHLLEGQLKHCGVYFSYREIKPHKII